VLYRGVTNVIRTLDVGRLVDGLLGHLSSFVERREPGWLRLDALAFVRNDVAVLVPAQIRSSMATIERRLHGKNVRVVDRPWACVDVDRHELVVPEPALTVHTAALGELRAGDRSVERAVPPGRYPLVGWGMAAGPGEQGRISRAMAATLAGATVVDRTDLEPQAMLNLLARLVAGVDPIALWADRPADLVRPVLALFG